MKKKPKKLTPVTSFGDDDSGRRSSRRMKAKEVHQGATWECKTDEDWKPFPKEVNDLLEASFESQKQIEFATKHVVKGIFRSRVETDHYQYTIDWETREQVNVKTGSRRKIRRVFHNQRDALFSGTGSSSGDLRETNAVEEQELPEKKKKGVAGMFEGAADYGKISHIIKQYSHTTSSMLALTSIPMRTSLPLASEYDHGRRY